jgi:glycosyltransferase involved in cell wall biosynthesis
MRGRPAEPFVSVVTPFHNTEGYLAQCIESVLAQTYENFEYILVDNQSTDRSGVIASEYAGKDRRIRFLRTERLLPQVPNYNFALEQIAPTSAYCKMVQADDWLFPRCLTEMVALAEAQPTTAIVSSYRLIETELGGGGLRPSQTVLSGRDACRLFLLGGVFLFGSPTTVLYRADVVQERKPFFAEGRLHEDTEAVYEILTDRDFGFVHQVLSFSRRDESSMTASVRDFLPDRLDRLMLIQRFGARYLASAEREACLADALERYYDGLAKRWLRDRLGAPDARFWEYQRKGLASIGEGVRSGLMMRSVAAVLLRKVFSPVRLQG